MSDAIGRMPDRVVACPVQVSAWMSEAMGAAREPMLDAPAHLYVLGARVVEGAHDAQPELIWSYPVTGE